MAGYAHSGTELPQLLAVEQVAEALGVSSQTVRRIVERGDLGAYRVGERQLRIAAAEVEAYLDRRREGRTP